MLDELVNEVLRGIIYALIGFDRPSTLHPDQRRALIERTAPYSPAAIGIYCLFGVHSAVLLLQIYQSENLPLPGLQYYVLGASCFTLLTPLLSVTISLIRPGRWSFVDFHTACALLAGLGPKGFSVGLLLLHALFLLLFLIGGN